MASFPSTLSPIAEEETFAGDKKHSDPFTSKGTTTSDFVESKSEEVTSFHKDSFVGLECDKVESSSKNSYSSTQPFSDSFSSKKASLNEPFSSCDHNSADSEVVEEENPFRKDSFVLLQEEELASIREQRSITDHKPQPYLDTVVKEPSFQDPFFQSDPFSIVEATKLSSGKDTVNFLPEEEPRSKFQLITPHSELADSIQIVPIEYDPFEEEPFFSEGTGENSHLTNNSAAVVDLSIPFSSFDGASPLLGSSFIDRESTDSSTQWHSFDHSFDPQFDTFDHNFGLADSLFSTVDHCLEPLVDQPVDKFNLEPPVDSELDNPSDKMAVDASTVPDFQDLDNTFSLDDLTNVIAEMELVTESLNEEPAPSPPTVPKKPKKPPSVAEKPKKAFPLVPAKKHEQTSTTKSNEQLTKKPQSFLNEVNLEKNKEKTQQIDIDIGDDVFSELEAQLQEEILARSDQVPDEVKEVLKELNAPYTMGLENIEAELGVKSDDSKGNVGDLISELHGMGDFENDEGEEIEGDDEEQVSELAESGLDDAYTGSSMDDLLSELKGMDDGGQSSGNPPPTLPPKPRKTSKQKTPVEEDPL